MRAVLKLYADHLRLMILYRLVYLALAVAPGCPEGKLWSVALSAVIRGVHTALEKDRAQ